MILPFATKNEGKLKEAEQVLMPCGIQVTPLSLELAEPDSGSIEEVAREKMRQVMEMGYRRAMVDDAGIFFAAYQQFPGILTKRIFERIGYKGIMKLLEGETRKVWFEGAVGVLWDGESAIFSARTSGRLLKMNPSDIQPEPGFPFNPLFVPDGETRTFAEMKPEEREAYSYRGRALKKAVHWLRGLQAD
ncbi:non-canonical purine NTP pyrophosphatase [Salinithrix halophila]|uniref:Non-canonical purine NTP pyrophosphatase n=1 Tax=Salinithrix halophila TaxID=1485204 RepID=A0ABV8JNB7_9BACL